MKIALTFALVVLYTAQLFAAADGPDFYRVTGVNKGDVLNMRSGPGTSFAIVVKIPYNSSDLENKVECVDSATLKAIKSDVPLKITGQVWCRIRYQKNYGWVNRRYLHESTEYPNEASYSDSASIAALNVDELVSARSKDHVFIYRLIAARDEIYPYLVFQKVRHGGEGDPSKIVEARRIDVASILGKLTQLTGRTHFVVSNLHASIPFRFNLTSVGRERVKYKCTLKIGAILPKCI